MKNTSPTAMLPAVSEQQELGCLRAATSPFRLSRRGGGSCGAEEPPASGGGEAATPALSRRLDRLEKPGVYKPLSGSIPSLTMHYYGSFDERALGQPPLFEAHSRGYAHAVLIGNLTGSVHTGLSINELAADGWIAPHVHAFEESFYILSGEATVTLDGASYRLGPGDYGAAKVGTPHAWRTAGRDPVRWLEMAAPQPKPYGAERDTFFLRDGYAPEAGGPLVPGRRDGALLGHFDASQIPRGSDRRTGGGTGLDGVFLEWLIDEQAGAAHHRLLFIEYQPGVGIGLHDHTFEEGYFILSGEVEATLDGQQYLARAGDVLWTAVGCVHAFRNVGSEPVRWLETFSPQPPRENVFRFRAEWEARARDLEGTP